MILELRFARTALQIDQTFVHKKFERHTNWVKDNKLESFCLQNTWGLQFRHGKFSLFDRKSDLENQDQPKD